MSSSLIAGLKNCRLLSPRRQPARGVSGTRIGFPIPENDPLRQTINPPAEIARANRPGHAGVTGGIEPSHLAENQVRHELMMVRRQVRSMGNDRNRQQSQPTVPNDSKESGAGNDAEIGTGRRTGPSLGRVSGVQRWSRGRWPGEVRSPSSGLP